MAFQRHRKALQLSAARVDQLERRLHKVQIRQITTAMEHAGAIIIQTRARIYIVKRRVVTLKASRRIYRWLWPKLVRKRASACIYRFLALCVGRSKRHAAHLLRAGLRILNALSVNVVRARARRAQAAACAAIALVKGCLGFACLSLAVSAVPAPSAPVPPADQTLPHATPGLRSMPANRPHKLVDRTVTLGKSVSKGRGAPSVNSIHIIASAPLPAHDLRAAKSTAVSPARPGRTYTPSSLAPPT